MSREDLSADGLLPEPLTPHQVEQLTHFMMPMG